MNVLFECIMIASFYAALIILFARWGEKDAVIKRSDWFTVETIGAGFLVGGISKLLQSPVEWTAVLYFFGAVLAGMVLISLQYRKSVKYISK